MSKPTVNYLAAQVEALTQAFELAVHTARAQQDVINALASRVAALEVGNRSVVPKAQRPELASRAARVAAYRAAHPGQSFTWADVEAAA